MRRVAAKQSREEVAPLAPRWRRLLILTFLFAHFDENPFGCWQAHEQAEKIRRLYIKNVFSIRIYWQTQ